MAKISIRHGKKSGTFSNFHRNLSKKQERLALNHQMTQWASIVSDGVCTIDPAFCQWVRHESGMPGDFAVPMRTTDLFKALHTNDRDKLSHSAN